MLRNPTALAGGAALACLVSAGCADKAAADLERCERLEEQKEYDRAITACELAYSQDPESIAGEKANAKIAELQRKKHKLAKRKARERNRPGGQVGDRDAPVDALQADRAARRKVVEELEAELAKAKHAAEIARLEEEIEAAKEILRKGPAP